jgi:choline dehydrogenase-like flavoprotein
MTALRPTGEDAYRDGTGAFVPQEVRVVRGADIDRDLEVRVDVCVIGTGAGGAVVAKELAEGGMTVAMLEEGERHTADEYTARVRDMSLRLYRDAGQVYTVGVPPILLPLGQAVGGTSQVNSATCFRTPEPVLARWRERFGLDQLTSEELDPYFRRVERELNVSQVPPDLAGRNAEVVKRGADALGWSGDYIYRNVRGCVGTGVCNFGCPTSAKQHVGLTYVPRAWDAGATTYTGTRAEALLRTGRTVRGVEARAASGARITVEAELVVVAAGAIHSPLILRREGLGGDSGELGRNLTIHPATAARALFDEDIDMSAGVPQSYFIDEFVDDGIILEGAAATPEYAAMSMPYVGAPHRELMQRYRNLSQFGVMVSDSGRGHVDERAGQVVIRYDLADEDRERFRRGLDVLAQIYWAAGAEKVFLPVGGLPVLENGDVESLRAHPLRSEELTLSAFHPLGTCRMGASPADSVVGPDGFVHGVEGLLAADGSVVPSSLGVNPQITIMALATRIAYGLLRKTPPVDEPYPEHMAAPRIAVAH